MNSLPLSDLICASGPRPVNEQFSQGANTSSRQSWQAPPQKGAAQWQNNDERNAASYHIFAGWIALWLTHFNWRANRAL